MIRTITMPAMIVTGIFPKRPVGGVGAEDGCRGNGSGWIGDRRGCAGAGVAGVTGVPQFSQNFTSSVNAAPQMVQNFCPIHYSLFESS